MTLIPVLEDRPGLGQVGRLLAPGGVSASGSDIVRELLTSLSLGPADRLNMRWPRVTHPS